MLLTPHLDFWCPAIVVCSCRNADTDKFNRESPSISKVVSGSPGFEVLVLVILSHETCCWDGNARTIVFRLGSRAQRVIY